MSLSLHAEQHFFVAVPHTLHVRLGPMTIVASRIGVAATESRSNLDPLATSLRVGVPGTGVAGATPSDREPMTTGVAALRSAPPTERGCAGMGGVSAWAGVFFFGGHGRRLGMAGASADSWT